MLYSFGHTNANVRNNSENGDRHVHQHRRMCAVIFVHAQRHAQTSPSLSLGKNGIQQSERVQGRGQRNCERQEGDREDRRREQTGYKVEKERRGKTNAKQNNAEQKSDGDVVNRGDVEEGSES